MKIKIYEFQSVGLCSVGVCGGRIMAESVELQYWAVLLAKLSLSDVGKLSQRVDQRSESKDGSVCPPVQNSKLFPTHTVIRPHQELTKYLKITL